MRRRTNRGAALVLVVLLLAALLVVVYALAALTRIDEQIAGSAVRRSEARQNALLALALAVGQLQVTSENDGVVTGMAGVSGVPAGAGNPARHWCGVWGPDGALVAWLASGVTGAVPALPAGAATIAIVGPGTLGADGVDREHVRVPLVEIGPAGDPGVSSGPGRLAWWVGDAGVKLSAVIPEAEAPVPGGRHAIDELIPALSPQATLLERVTAYGQLAFVPPGGVTPGVLAANFHAVAVTHRRIDPATGAGRAGVLNINTTSARFWRGLAATYNRLAPPENRLGIAPETFAARLLGWSGSGAAGEWPQLSVAAFAGSARLEQALANSGVGADQFAMVLEAWLAVRSDTFLVRGYGEAHDPVDRTRVESVAWCEALVQRTGEPLAGHGRRFRVVQFRWLGSDDV